MKNFFKTTYIVLLFCAVFIYPNISFASSLPMGYLEKSNMILDINNVQLETYSVFGTNYVPISKLTHAGFQVTFTSKHEPIYIEVPKTLSALNEAQLHLEATLDQKPYNLYPGEVFIGHFKTHALICENKVLIPISTFNVLFNTVLSDNHYTLMPKIESPIVATQTSIQNQCSETLEVTITDLYWDKALIQKTLDFTLGPNEIISREPSSDKTYLSTIVSTVTYPNFLYKNGSLCGQDNTQLLLLNDFAKTLPEDIGDQTDISTLHWAEQTINAKGLTSQTRYLVWTSLDKQKTFIFTLDQGRWHLNKHFICSSGKPSTPTPPGIYKLTKKVASFGQAKGYCCKYAFGFIGTTYLYHSILFDKTGTYLIGSREELGTKASEGCVRLSPENSLWFYNNLLSGSTVWIG